MHRPSVQDIRALAADDLYSAVLRMFQDAPPGKVLDVPAGHGAFAQELLRLGFDDIDCLDINFDAFSLKNSKVRFQQHDVIHRLPFDDETFDYVFSIEGIEHFENPWTFTKELCRVLKPGGRLFISTPNTFSIDARVKYIFGGYFPRFRPLMLTPDQVMNQPVDDAHISPIYFWQLNFFLMQGGVSIRRVSTNAEVHRPQWIKRVLESALAGIIRWNIRKRRFPDHGVTSDAVLFGDCLILECVKAT